MTKPIVIKQANPNRFPIRLVSYTNDEGDETVYEVQETDDEGYWMEDTQSTPDLKVAEHIFTKRCKELSETPNQAAQDAYDEEHGTINGYAPYQYNREY